MCQAPWCFLGFLKVKLGAGKAQPICSLSQPHWELAKTPHC